MPPAPTLAQNRGSASPRHAKDEVLPTPSRSRSSKTKAQTPARISAEVSARTPAQALTAVADDVDSLQATVPTPGGKKGSFRRLIINLALIYLGYTVFFVCPKKPDSESNAVCDRILRFENWLRPYSEPYLDQYVRPLYKQGEKYYVEVAPVFKTASDKTRLSYNQYAQPHVNKAFDALYTDNVKATFNSYQKHAQGPVDYVKKKSKDVNDHVWRIHETHVQPVIHKVTPHAKAAWDSATVNANNIYDTASVLYMKHVNPYSQQLFTIVSDTAKGAMETFAKYTDEIWGTNFSKESQSMVGRTTNRVSRKAKEDRKKAREVAKAKADALAESVKDALLKKAKDAQKIAVENSEAAMAAGMAGAHEAKKAADEHVKIPKASDIKAAAEHLVETVTEAVAKKAHEAQKVVVDEAEYLRALADEKAAEAGKISEHLKKAVVEKAHEAQEAVAQQAEHIKHSAQEQIHRAQEVGSSIVATVTRAAHGAKESVESEAEHVAELAKKKKEDLERHAQQEAAELKLVALEKEKQEKKIADEASLKAQKAFNAVGQKAEDIKAKVVETEKKAEKAAREQVEGIREIAQEHAKNVQNIAQEQVEGVKKTVQEHAKNAQNIAQEKVEGVKETVQEHAKNAQNIAQEKVEGVKETVQEHAKNAQNIAQEKVEGVKETVQEHAKNAQNIAQEKVQGVKETAQEHAKNAQNIAQEQVESVKKTVQEHAKNAQNIAQEKVEDVKKTAQEKADWIMESADQIVMGGKENANKAKDYVAHQAKEAGDQVEHAKDTAKHKVHDAHTASKIALAAMLASIETTFGKFHEYEDTETKTLWSNLQGAINDHIANAKESARDLENANREAYELFESYVRDWRNRGGELEDRLAKLNQRSVESIKKITLKAEEDQKVAKSKAEVLSNNAEVLLTGTTEFWSRRLAASKETAASELSAFKDTSSEDDEKTVRSKLAELELTAKGKLEETGSDVRQKTKQLLKQIDEIWSQSEADSQEYVKRMRELTEKEQEEAEEAEPNVRIAMEEPGSGHRHHHHL
ncbi:hypothetical protein BGZ58_001449 [Dissophora ornata]|nr:hypothetical protein BGZ58_001449 [Dissophora ornata]